MIRLSPRVFEVSKILYLFQVGKDFGFLKLLEVLHFQKLSFSHQKKFLQDRHKASHRTRLFQRRLEFRNQTLVSKVVSATRHGQNDFSYVTILKERSTLIPAAPTSNTPIHPTSI